MANCEGCNKSNVLKKLQAYAAPDGACSVNSCTISKYHIHWFCENGCASSFRKGIVDKEIKGMNFDLKFWLI